jgi:type IV pilus assembly protein PilM
MPVPTGMPEDELNDVIRQEAINNLPFPVDEANLDHAVLPATERTDPDGVRRVDVILAAIQRIVVDSYWRMSEAAGVKLGKLDVSSLSVIRALSFANMLKDDNSLSMAVNIRNDATDITLIKRGMPLFSRSVLLGVETLGEAISRSIDSPVDEAISLLPKLQLGAVPTSDPRLGQAAQVARSVFGDLTAEVGRSLEFYMSQVGSVQVDQVILTGAGCVVPGIHDFISNRLNIATTVADPFSNVIYDRAQILDERRAVYAMLLGLVIDPAQTPLKTVELDLNQGGRAPEAAAAGEEGEEGEAEEVETPWFVPATAAGLLLAVIAGGVWGGFAYVGQQKQQQYEDTVAKVEQQNKEIEQMGKDQADLTALLAKEATLEHIVKHGEPRVALLQTVRDSIPPGVQVRTMTMGESKINLMCNAVDFTKAAHYAINLNGTNLLTNARVKQVHRVQKAPEQIACEIEADIRPETQMAQVDLGKIAKEGPGRPQLIYFYDKGSPVCQSFQPIIDSAQKKFSSAVDFETVDINDPNNKDMVEQYGAKVVPQTCIIDGKGQVVNSFEGPVAANTLAQVLDKISKVASTGGTK